MKKIIRSTIVLGLATLALLVFMYFYHNRGTTDATLGVERVYDGWTEEQETFFDSLRNTNENTVFLFDGLGVTKEVMDSRVEKWTNLQLNLLGKDPLPKHCIFVYEMMQFDRDGVKVMDGNGKWHRAMTYGTEPVVHIFLPYHNPQTDDPHVTALVRCMNGCVKLQDPVKSVPVGIKPPPTTSAWSIPADQLYDLLGVITKKTYAYDYVPDMIAWTKFAQEHSVPLMYEDTTGIWQSCSYGDVDNFLCHGYKVALDLPVGTKIFQDIDVFGIEPVVQAIFLQYPDADPDDVLFVVQYDEFDEFDLYDSDY